MLVDFMVTVSKQQIAEWIILDYLAKTHSLIEKISFYLKKYNTTFEEFETQIKSAPQENKNKTILKIATFFVGLVIVLVIGAIIMRKKEPEQ